MCLRAYLLFNALFRLYLLCFFFSLMYFSSIFVLDAEQTIRFIDLILLLRFFKQFLKREKLKEGKKNLITGIN
jgi:hypothetical protein